MDTTVKPKKAPAPTDKPGVAIARVLTGIGLKRGTDFKVRTVKGAARVDILSDKGRKLAYAYSSRIVEATSRAGFQVDVTPDWATQTASIGLVTLPHVAEVLTRTPFMYAQDHEWTPSFGGRRWTMTLKGTDYTVSLRGDGDWYMTSSDGFRPRFMGDAGHLAVQDATAIAVSRESLKAAR